MSRSTRIVISVLISLAVIAVIFTSVQAAFPNTGASLGKAHVDAGLNPDLSHSRQAPAAAVELQGYEAQLDSLSTHMEGGHGCGADKQSSLDD